MDDASTTPQACSNTLWAVAKLGCDSSQQVIAVAQRFQSLLELANAQNCSLTLWALAKMRMNEQGDIVSSVLRRGL